MALTDDQREAIREEEKTRWLAREELKRTKRPHLLVLATAWALSLTALAALFRAF